MQTFSSAFRQRFVYSLGSSWAIGLHSLKRDFTISHFKRDEKDQTLAKLLQEEHVEIQKVDEFFKQLRNHEASDLFRFMKVLREAHGVRVSPVTSKCILLALSRSFSSLDEVETIFDSVVEDMKELGSPLGNIQLNSVILQLLSEEETLRAYQMFVVMSKCIKELNFLLYSKLIGQLSSYNLTKELKNLIQVRKALVPSNPKNFVLQEVHALSNVSLGSIAFESLKEMAEHGFQDCVGTVVLNALIKERNVKLSFECIEFLVNHKIDFSISLVCKATEISIESDIEPLLSFLEKFKGDSKMIWTVLGTLNRANSVDYILKTFKIAKEFHVTPTETHYNDSIIKLCNGGLFTDCFQMYLLMKQDNVSLPEQVMLKLSKALSGGNLAKEAVFLLQDIRDIEMYQTSAIYSTLLLSMARGRDPDNALLTYDLMLKLKLVPEVTVFSGLLSSLYGDQYFSRAMEIFRSIPSFKIPLDIKMYTSMIRCCASEEYWEEGVKLFDEMCQVIPPDTVAFNMTLKCLAAGKMWERALELFHIMLDNQIPRDDGTYTALLRCFYRSGVMGRDATELFETMKADNIKPTTSVVNGLLSCLSKEVDAHTLKAKFEEMRSSGIATDQATMNTLLMVYFHSSELKPALELFHDMMQYGHAPDVVSFNILLKICDRVKVGLFALDVFDELKSAGVKPNEITYTQLLSAIKDDGMWEEAMELFRDARDEGIVANVRMYNALITCMKKSGQWERAVMFYDQMKCNGIEPDQATHRIMEYCFERAGYPERRLELSLDISRKIQRTE